jgi:hypothetical protein
MQRQTRHLQHLAIGSVKDFSCDDTAMTIRHLAGIPGMWRSRCGRPITRLQQVDAFDCDN